jgi:hypothetical protein
MAPKKTTTLNLRIDPAFVSAAADHLRRNERNPERHDRPVPLSQSMKSTAEIATLLHSIMQVTKHELPPLVAQDYGRHPARNMG